MRKLLQGIVDFRKTLTEENRSLFANLALGQKPDALFIACSDSRVAPNVFASTNPGDLFVVRNVGNFIPPSGSSLHDSSILAALEFSISSLNVSDIIVCGHSECGAIHAIMQNDLTTCCPNLHCWLHHGQAALAKIEQGIILNPTLAKHNQVSQMNVLVQMDNIKSHPFIQERIQHHHLRIHGWWFDIAHADVYCYEPSLHAFILIDETEASAILKRLDKLPHTSG